MADKDRPDSGNPSDDARKIDDDTLAKRSQGNQSPAGTGSHATHTREAAAETSDNKAKGNEARLAGYGKGNTRPETGRN
jgi:hypothetical protein